MNRKSNGRTMSMPLGLTVGALVSLAVTLMAAAILAKLVDSGNLLWENIGYGIMILLLSASFLGAFTAYQKIKRQRMMVCGLSGLIYFGCLMAITALFFGGQYEAVGVTGGLVLAGSLCAGLLGQGRGRTKKRRKAAALHR